MTDTIVYAVCGALAAGSMWYFNGPDWGGVPVALMLIILWEMQKRGSAKP